jgi:signal transduction histidine kinase
MRLADFIIQNMEPILQQWEDFAKTLTPAADGMDALALRDHAEHMLRNIAADLQTFQSPEARILRSHGNAPPSSDVTSAQTHADLRHASGFTIAQVIAEYRALRTSVLALWLPPDHVSKDQEVRDVIRFNEAIDQALAESVVTYASDVEMTRNVFLGVLGHDLRSPLGAISLSAEVLLHAGDLAPKSIKNVSYIYRSVKRSIKIVGDLLDFTRTQLGSGIPVRIERNDLAQMCKEMVEEAKAYHPDREIDLHSDYSLPWWFDRSRMEQVLTNLIGNAIQHGEAKAPVTVALTAADGYASISVHNVGLPIDKSARASLFNPLTRHLRDGDVEYGAEAGLGLGLFIASAIVSAHQGQIDVQSEADSGTTFTVRLPMNLP